MIAGFTVLTLTHRAADLALIGLVTKEMGVGEELQERLSSIKNSLQAQEILFLSTCNRIAFVFYHDTPVNADFSETFIQQVMTSSSDEVKNKVLNYLLIKFNVFFTFLL